MVDRENMSFKSMNKNNGSVSISILLVWFLFIIIIIFSFVIEIYFINLKADMARDDIVLSNLAVYKEIDLKALGDTPSKFRIADPYMALNTFNIYLQKNMRLDEYMKGKDNSIALGLVAVKSYIIYNITGNSAEIYTYNNDSKTFIGSSVDDITNNPIITPCGTLIKKTSIHTELEFNIETMLKGIVGNYKTVNVMADTDITY